MSPIPEPHQLNDLQHWMLSALIEPKKCNAKDISDTFLPGPHLSEAQCLFIYQRSYILRLIDCMESQFPATSYTLGRPLFYDFCRDYLRDCPSDSYTLYELGRRFSTWIDHNRPDKDSGEDYRESWIDFLVDLVCYERALFQLFDAPCPADLQLATIDDSDDCLAPHPLLRLIAHRYPIALYYHEIRAGRTPPKPSYSPRHTAILRPEWTSRAYPITFTQFEFLTSLQQGANIPQTLSKLAVNTNQPIRAVEQSWQNEVRIPWIKAGFFIRSPFLQQ